MLLAVIILREFLSSIVLVLVPVDPFRTCWYRQDDKILVDD